MRRKITVLTCLAVLAFAGAGTALAGGPRHRGPQYRAPAVGHGPHHREPWNTGYRGRGWQTGYRGPKGPACPPPAPVCRPQVGVVAYPPYAQPVYPAYPQLGFGVAGRNFSFWLQK